MNSVHVRDSFNFASSCGVVHLFSHIWRFQVFRFSSEVAVALFDFFMLSCCNILLSYRFLLVFIAHVCFQPDRFEGMPRYLSRLLGPSDDSLDCIVRGCYLPELSIGDWILFSKMGAYAMTGSLASLDDYELTRPKCHYTMCARDW